MFKALERQLAALGHYDAFIMGPTLHLLRAALRVLGPHRRYLHRPHSTPCPSYVASRSLTQTAWNPTLLRPDPSSAIARLKDQPGKNLIKYGTSRLDDTLVRDHLIDEFRSWIMPVVRRRRATAVRDVDTSGLQLRLTGERSLENGSAILTYAPRPPRRAG